MWLHFSDKSPASFESASAKNATIASGSEQRAAQAKLNVRIWWAILVRWRVNGCGVRVVAIGLFRTNDNGAIGIPPSVPPARFDRRSTLTFDVPKPCVMRTRYGNREFSKAHHFHPLLPARSSLPSQAWLQGVYPIA